MAHKLKMWIPVILAIGWSLYLNEWSREIVYKLIQGDFASAYQLYEGDSKAAVTEQPKKDSDNFEKLLTIEELAKFNNVDVGLYLSILGQVFDVSKGGEHYNKGSTYHAFVGRDASKAFLTGDFTSEGLTDDVSELKNSEATALSNWLKTYHEKYIYKGKLVGRFYDNNGKPTKALHQFQKKVADANKEKLYEDEINRKYPPCNVEWNEEIGTRYWCSSMSGGIPREWTGVPREYFEHKKRCACVNLDSSDYLENQAKFRAYEDCAIDATSCIIKS